MVNVYEPKSRILMIHNVIRNHHIVFIIKRKIDIQNWGKNGTERRRGKVSNKYMLVKIIKG